MKKTRFILLALVAALVLMGAAYAAWTQSFTITSVVETGELFVKVENTSNAVTVDKAHNGSYVPADADSGLDMDNLVNTTKATNAAGDVETLTTVAYDLGNVYPGTKITSVLEFTNIGTIKAATSATSTNVSNNALWNEIIIRVNGTDVTGAGDQKMTNLKDAIMNAVGDLDTDVSKTVTIEQELPYSSTNATESQNLAWSVTLNFAQAAN